MPVEPQGPTCAVFPSSLGLSSMPGGYSDELPAELAALVHQSALLPLFARQNRDKFKTEMCRNFAQTGQCRYGDKSQFAHGPQDLRARRLPSQYKTRICRTFSQAGTCPYGSKCRFIHGNESDLAALQLQEEMIAMGLTPEQAGAALPWAAQLSDLAEKQLAAAAVQQQLAAQQQPVMPPLPPGAGPPLPPGGPPSLLPGAPPNMLHGAPHTLNTYGYSVRRYSPHSTLSGRRKSHVTSGDRTRRP